MRTLSVLSGGGDAPELLRRLLEGRQARLLPAGAEASLLLVLPDWTGGEAPRRCRLLLTPPDKASLLRGLRAERVVSYGAGERESVGFTSLRPDGLTLETRRALPTLAGRLLEPQEKSMTCPAADAQTRLALCAALLLLDLDA